MILISQDKHLRMDQEGRLFWQPDSTNPLPGAEAGRVVKGDSILHPTVQLSGDVAADQLQAALDKALSEALAPLFALLAGDGFTDASKAIAERLQTALGILPREALDDVIATLDEEGRKALRARKVRMGPLLVFMPELNKPAAVNLRAFLLTLWNGKSLPAEKPNDGIVSFTVEGKDIDKDYYRSIGYPVYGPRSIRVDMLDRVICAVYDGAKDGKFQAQHQMAEWLGSNITDLYAVLEAMGHTKIHDPLEEKIKAEEGQIGTTPATETAPAAEADKPAEAAAPAAPVAAVKPELATFRLKRGKANASKPPEFKPRANKKFDPSTNKPKRDDKPKNKGPRKPDKKREERDDSDRVYTARPKTVEASPFAILQQLKTGSKE